MDYAQLQSLTRILDQQIKDIDPFCNYLKELVISGRLPNEDLWKVIFFLGGHLFVYHPETFRPFLSNILGENTDVMNRTALEIQFMHSEDLIKGKE